MESRAKAAGHAIHQQLIVFPLGLLATAVAFDVIGLLTDDERSTFASYPMIVVGVVVGPAASVVGLIDYLAVPRGTRAKRIATLHGGGNVIMLVLFTGSALLRSGSQGNMPGTAAFLLAVIALVLAAGTGWLGGELVGRLGVGIDDDAGLNAPARLTTRISIRHGNWTDS